MTKLIEGKHKSIYVYLLLALMLGSLMLGYIHTLVVATIFILYFFVILNKYEKGVVCAFCLCSLLGFFLILWKIPLPGTVISFVILLLFVRKDVLSMFRNNLSLRSFLYPVYILFVLFILYLLTGRTEYSDEKMRVMIVNFIVSGIGLLLLVSFKNINMQKLAPIFFIESCFWIVFGIDTFRNFQPSNLFDFSFFRKMCTSTSTDDVLSISYHTVGLASLSALSYFLCGKKKLKTADYIFVLLCFWVMLISGARQAIFGGFLVLFVYITTSKGSFKISRLILSILFLCVAYYILQSLQIDYLQDIFSSSKDFDSRLNRNYDYPLDIIRNNFLFGVGFGNYYNPFTEEIYPHNIFLEIFCEFGFIGFCLLMLPIVFFISSRRFCLRNKLANDASGLILWMPFLVRALISDDLSGNIVVFSSFFIFFYNSGISQRKISGL